MTFDVEINGRVRTVSIERGPQRRYRVTIDGEGREVDAARIGTLGLSLLLDPASGISRDFQIAPAGRNGELLVRIDGRTLAATVDGSRTGRTQGDAGTDAHGEQSVRAPMPGRIVRLLVAAGETVAARQPVVVVEAMKMENELRAPKAGRVKLVAIKAGDSVEAGRVLVVIE